MRTSRRQFLATTALAGVVLPHVHAAGSDTIRLALIGSGNRGSGAVGHAMGATGSTVKLWTMADLYEDRLQKSHASLSAAFGDRVEVPSERQFVGFAAFKHAIDSLRPHSGDI